jgi:hypothetical protein
MNRITRLAVLITALLSLCAITSTATNAVTWHNTGSTAFTATAGATTLTVGGNTLSCSGATVTGTASTSTFVGATWPAASGTAVFAPCSMAGQTATAHCTFTVTAVSWTAGPPATTAGFVDATCHSSLTAGGPVLCVTRGAPPGSFKNPTAPTKASGTMNASSVLTITNGAGASCPFGTGTATLSETTYSITTANGAGLGPIITRTP